MYLYRSALNINIIANDIISFTLPEHFLHKISINYVGSAHNISFVVQWNAVK